MLEDDRVNEAAVSAFDDLSDLPVRVTRREGAKLVSQRFFSVNHRTLERWPLATQQLNGKTHILTRDLFDYAAKCLAVAPVVRPGKTT
jgi:hypothetical protein